jgi:photosystem II stability/assembly factor-like uncharacterized protein
MVPTWAGRLTRISFVLLSAIVAGSTFPSAAIGQGRGPGVTTGDGAWTWQNPSPQGNDLNHLAFADTETGWAVGRRGLIMRTGDGGASWAIQHSDAVDDLIGITVLNHNTALVAGTRGTILSTVDGGAVWTRRSTGVTQDLLRIQFADETTAYAIGLAGRVVRSSDAGVSWETLEPLEGLPTLVRLHFFDASRGYVLGRTAQSSFLFFTGDGGSTWERYAAPALLEDIRFVNTTRALAVGDHGLVVLIRFGLTGISSTRVNVPTAASLFGLAFSDADTSHIVGDGGVVLKSVDGGESWAALPPPRPASVRLGAVTFIGEAVGYAVGARGTVVKTSDAGASWTNLTSGNRGGLRSVHFLSDEVGVAVGERGTIVKSADRGDTWRSIPSGTQRDLNAVRFLNRQNGFAVGDGGIILRSDDSGESWRPLESPVGFNLRAIGLAGDPASGELRVGVIVGDTNLVLRTADQGNTWAAVDLPGPPDQLFAVHFPEPRIGYVGGLRTIWQSTDYGQSWRIVAGAGRTPRDPLGFAFPSVNRGYAVGQNGQIFRTNDGGTTWLPQNIPLRVNLRSVYFLDEENGYVVGDAGSVLVTNNGGASWTIVNAGTHLSLWSVQFLDHAVGIATGQGGVVLKSTSGGLATRNIPPAVAVIAPRDDQTDISVDDQVRITFNKAIAFDPAHYGSLFRLTDAAGRLVPATLTYDEANRRVFIIPRQSLDPGTSYSVAVGGGSDGITDLDGRRMVYDYVTRFRTACSIRVTEGFGRLTALDPDVRLKIGCATDQAATTSAIEQVFERGHMLYLARERQVLVTYFGDGRWTRYDDTFRVGDAEPPLTPPEGLFAPQRGFGKIWREQPGVRQRLGWAVGSERPFEGREQSFTGGVMVWTGTNQWMLRIYYADTTALAVPDPTQPAVTEVTLGTGTEDSGTP